MESQTLDGLVQKKRVPCEGGATHTVRGPRYRRPFPQRLRACPRTVCGRGDSPLLLTRPATRVPRRKRGRSPTVLGREDRPTADQAEKLTATRPPLAELSTNLSARRSLYRNCWPNFETVVHRRRGRSHSNSLEKQHVPLCPLKLCTRQSSGPRIATG